MSAQTAQARKTVTGPVTPVIIKTGGDPGDPIVPEVLGIPKPVSINSGSISFAETEPGLTWASSQSTSFGRITGLTIEDGSSPIEHTIDPTADLASVTFKFGTAQLIAMESGVPACNDVVLLIASPEVPFNVPAIGDWTNASAAFTHRLTEVTLMVGDHQRVLHKCESDNVTVKILFE